MMHRQRAFIVHRTPNRMRIKIPGERRNTLFFARLQRELIEHRDIVVVDVNPLTASVLIIHRDGMGLGDLNLDVFAPFRGAASESGICTRGMRGAHARADWNDDALFLVLKIAVAIITRQPAWQVLEWIVEMVFGAAVKSLATRASHALVVEDHPPEPVLLAAA